MQSKWDLWAVRCSKPSLCCRWKITYMKCLLQNGTFLAAISSRISHATAELIEQAFCFFLIDKRLQSSPSTAGVTFSSSSCGRCRRARQESRWGFGHVPPPVSSSACFLRSRMNTCAWRWVTAAHSPPLWLTCCGPKKWWLAPQTMIAVNAGRQRVNNIRVGDIWVDTEGGGDWHMYVLVKVFQQVCRKLQLRGSYLKN